MGNLPISAHITVVSNTPAAIPDAAGALPSAAAAADGSDFSNLLAGQIAAKTETLVAGKQDLVQAELAQGEEAVSGLPPNVDPAASIGLTVVGFSPLPAVPLAAALNEADTELGKDVSRLELGRGLGLIEARQGAAAGADALAPAPGEHAELPANFAAQPPSLPAKGLGEVMREDLISGERGFKLSARPELSDIGPAERAPGLLAHGIVAAKADTVSQPAQLPPVAVESRIGAPGWGAELGQKVVWLANQQQQVAQINVTPAHLGPIEIRLNLASDQASATFVSPHAAVRDAIEAALPRLREMLAESGLTLGNVDVSPHSFGHSSGQFPQENPQPGDRSRSLVPELAAMRAGEQGLHAGTLPGMTHGSTGLVDIFA